MQVNIKIVVRVRPFNQIEKGSECVIKMDDSTTTITSQAGDKSFNFHRCYWSHDSIEHDLVTNQVIFEDLGKEILKNAYEGYNSTIFAYGQTGSGKSFTIEGYTPEKGILQLICEELFLKRISENKAKGYQTSVHVSYLQIYNEQLRDLLDPSRKNLKIYSASNVVSVQNLSTHQVNTFEQLLGLFYEGKKIRVVGAHSMNKNSSRSHAVFTIYYKEKGVKETRNCKINIVDLAGSQRQSKTGAEGLRLQEAANINKSLTNLGIVIQALATNCTKKQKGFVPFRNSELTHLLSQSLSGNSKTFMIAALSPSKNNYEQTLSTLRFAERVACIRTTAKKNQELKASENTALMKEIERLKRQLQLEKQKSPQMIVEREEVIIDDSEEKVKEISALLEELNKQKQLLEMSEEKRKQYEKEEEEKAKLNRMKAFMEAGMTAENLTEKAAPYLVNLSDDPSLSGMLLYFLKNDETRLGNFQDDSNEIKINGLGIRKFHCTFLKGLKYIEIEPMPDARVILNGNEVSTRTKVDHLDKLVFGAGNSYRLIIPGMGEKMPSKLSKQTSVMGIEWEEQLASSAAGSNIVQFMKQLHDRLNKNEFLSFLPKIKESMKLIDEANEFTSLRYKKFPLRERNIEFSLQIVIDIKNYNKAPELAAVCKHKQTGEELFLWAIEKLGKKAQEMQMWYEGKSQFLDRNYNEGDPWFQATDKYFKEKEKINRMKVSEQQAYFEGKINAEEEECNELKKYIKGMKQEFQEQKFSEDDVEMYADVFFRELITDKQSVKKYKQKREAKPMLHDLVRKFMELVAEINMKKMNIRAYKEVISNLTVEAKPVAVNYVYAPKIIDL